MKRRALLIGLLVVGLSGGVLARFYMLPKEVVEGVASDGTRKVYGPWIELPETETVVQPGRKCDMILELDASVPTFRFRRSGEQSGVALKELLPSSDIEPKPGQGPESLTSGTHCTYTPENKTSKSQTFQIRIRRFWNEVPVSREETYWDGRVEETHFTRKQVVTSPWIDFEIDLQKIR